MTRLLWPFVKASQNRNEIRCRDCDLFTFWQKLWDIVRPQPLAAVAAARCTICPNKIAKSLKVCLIILSKSSLPPSQTFVPVQLFEAYNSRVRNASAPRWCAWYEGRGWCSHDLAIFALSSFPFPPWYDIYKTRDCSEITRSDYIITARHKKLIESPIFSSLSEE